MRRRPVELLLIGALLWLVAGCNGGDTPALTSASELASSAVAAATVGAATQAPAAAPPAEVIVTGEAAVPDVAAASKEEAAPAATPLPGPLVSPSDVLQSFRVRAGVVITAALANGATRIETATAEGAWVRTDGPFGYDAAFTLAGSSGDKHQAFGFVMLGNDAAIQSGEQWTTIARSKDMPYSDPNALMVMPFMTHVNYGENMGRETVAGVATTHYRLTDPEAFVAIVGDALGAQDGAVQSIVFEGWVADAGYVVKYALQANLSGVTTKDDQGADIKADEYVSAAYALSNLDGPVTIAWPDGAPAPGTIAVSGFDVNTFPAPEGAVVSPTLGMIEVVAPQAEAEVTAFYREQLTALGWTVSGEYGFYTATKAGTTISLTVNAEGKGTRVEVYSGGE